MRGVKAERAHATRARLIEVATGLFAADGYEATSIGTVLREAGMSRGALYHHFENKEALLEAVYEAAQARVAEQIMAEAADAPSPLEALRRGVRAWLQRVRDPVVRQITLIDAPSVLGWQRWREIDEKHFLGACKAAMQEAAGDALPPQRIDTLAHMFLACLGEVAMMIARGDQSDAAIEEGVAVVDDFLTRMLS
jgi:AcrR family transcriptional regulator